jgi:hypothetical protein
VTTYIGKLILYPHTSRIAFIEDLELAIRLATLSNAEVGSSIKYLFSSEPWLSDLIQIKRMSKTIVMSKIVFKNLKIKLNTISNIVDLVSILSPTIAAVKNIRFL